jgi:hypothetical protein
MMRKRFAFATVATMLGGASAMKYYFFPRLAILGWYVAIALIATLVVVHHRRRVPSFIPANEQKSA